MRWRFVSFRSGAREWKEIRSDRRHDTISIDLALLPKYRHLNGVSRRVPRKVRRPKVPLWKGVRGRASITEGQENDTAAWFGYHGSSKPIMQRSWSLCEDGSA